MIQVSFSKIHRAEVTVPDNVFEVFGHTQVYADISGQASACVEVSGSNRYSEVVEWGESPNFQDVEAFAKVWKGWLLQCETILAARFD